ncbi:hypothetical protein SAMN05444000_10662 [Shimia gijangensis]|uniref:Uncharacterized protein n=1 Tax=Shimia gijangensis TaxID=1470563 RepID=A0A1M6HIT4_9RHOB|nr:autotransporter outer membrane beta-barrel domain-containing protein [Shimia gijangensis]SHJ22062.1 hypothetical protein SAMN05444000_10662 [Shimia gijangensis]
MFMAAGLAQSASGEEDLITSPDETILDDGTPDGILPQLGILLKFPDHLQLRRPESAALSDEPIVYDRKLPFFAQQAVDRGFSLPLPYGISGILVSNQQLQNITDLSVALSKGAPPPPGTPLVPIPFVTLENVISKTDSAQVKLDAWILPNLNVFGSFGKVDGSANLDVVVDLDSMFPPPVCTPIDPCGTATANFTAGIDARTLTIGATAVYGWDNFFLTGTASLTDTLGSSSDTVVRSQNASLRFGRHWIVNGKTVFAPYIGVSYLNYDQYIEGVTALANAFPDNDDLNVRYRARSTNVDKFSGVIGLNIGFENGMGVQMEYNKSPSGERFVLSGVQRF